MRQLKSYMIKQDNIYYIHFTYKFIHISCLSICKFVIRSNSSFRSFQERKFLIFKSQIQKHVKSLIIIKENIRCFMGMYIKFKSPYICAGQLGSTSIVLVFACICMFVFHRSCICFVDLEFHYFVIGIGVTHLKHSENYLIPPHFINFSIFIYRFYICFLKIKKLNKLTRAHSLSEVLFAYEICIDNIKDLLDYTNP